MNLQKYILDDKVYNVLMEDVIVFTIKPISSFEMKKFRYRFHINHLFFVRIKRSNLKRWFASNFLLNVIDLNYFEGMSELYVVPLKEVSTLLNFSKNLEGLFPSFYYKRLLFIKLDGVILTSLQINNIIKYFIYKFFYSHEEFLINNLYMHTGLNHLKIFQVIFFLLTYYMSNKIINGDFTTSS
jgi:hypothetical protein